MITSPACALYAACGLLVEAPVIPPVASDRACARSERAIGREQVIRQEAEGGVVTRGPFLRTLSLKLPKGTVIMVG